MFQSPVGWIIVEIALSALSCRALNCQYLRILPIAVVAAQSCVVSRFVSGPNLLVIRRHDSFVGQKLWSSIDVCHEKQWKSNFCVSNIHFCPLYILFVQTVGRRASPCDADTGPTVYAADLGAVLRKMQSKGLTVSSLHRARGPYS